jgi:thymidylate synthase (FAD)
MIIVEPSYKIECLIESPLKLIEVHGRKCYKSEDKITENSNIEFTKMIRGKHHNSVLEHSFMSVSFVMDRGMSHELVRHRLASYSQESTRYCNYSKNKFGNEITVIKPMDFGENHMAEFA